MEDSKGTIIVIAILGLLGLWILSSKKASASSDITDMYNRWERIDGPTVVPGNIDPEPMSPLYLNEKRIKIIRGDDGHIEELVINHTIKKNTLSQIPEGVFEI